LRSRGIDEVSARKLLLEAFASECLDRMKPGPVRLHIAQLIREHISQMAIATPTEKEAESASNRERNWEEVQ
jgi:hypothetical protein